MSFTIVLLVLMIVFVVYGVSLFNRLVMLDQQAKNAWSQIDVQLKRRYDLIPNLIETVKGYMNYEQETLQKVIEARSRAMQATSIGERAIAEEGLTGVLGKLFALAESYPDLKANQNMLSLQEELKSTENKVAFSRQFYNDSVTRYNTALQVFPSNIVANMGGRQPKELFEISNPDEKNPVKVQF